jgi:Domain of unknown function (DUF1922)
MYIIFRCDCGRAMYTRKGVDQKKCVCGKKLKVNKRRIIAETNEHLNASEIVQKLQEEKFGKAYFTTADKL